MPSKTPKQQTTSSTSSPSLNERFSLLGDKHKNRSKQQPQQRGGSSTTTGKRTISRPGTRQGPLSLKINSLAPQNQIRRERRGGRSGLLSRLTENRPRRRVGSGVADIVQQSPSGNARGGKNGRGGRGRRGNRGGSPRTGEWKKKTTLQQLDKELENYMDISDQNTLGGANTSGGRGGREGRGGRGGRGGRRGGRGGRGGRNNTEKKPAVTHDDLDKDIDSYMDSK